MSSRGLGYHRDYRGVYDDRRAMSAPTEDEEIAGMAPRSVTDPFFLVLFLAYLGGMLVVVDYALKHSNLDRLTHGFNFRGEQCGVDAAVADKSMVFYCPTGFNPVGEPIDVDLAHPICVSLCPSNVNATLEQSFLCYKGAKETKKVTTNPKDGDLNLVIGFDFEYTRAYETRPYMDRYCLPATMNTQLTTEVRNHLRNQSWVTMLQLKVGGLRSSWVALLAAAGFSVAFSYLFLLLLEHMARCLIFFVLMLVIFSSLTSGTYLVYAWQHGGVSSGTGDAWVDLIVGIVLLTIGFLLFLLLACCQSLIESATSCIEVASECIFCMPSLLLQPLLELILKLGALAALCMGLVHLIASGEAWQQQVNIGGEEVSGLSRSFTWTDRQKCMLVFWVVGFLWIMEVFSSWAQLVVSYCVSLWYFTPLEYDESKDLPAFPLGRGASIALLFHFGTIVYGAFLIVMLRPFRIFFGFLDACAREESRNCVGECLAVCLHCCISCFRQQLVFVNKNAYIDVVMNSTNFCEAAKHVFAVLSSEAGAAASLIGICGIFQAAGLAFAFLAGGSLAYFLSISFECFLDDTSTWYIPDPIFVGVVAGVISFSVASGFMVIFDQASDTLLYAYVRDKAHPQTDKATGNVVPFAPELLQRVVDEHLKPWEY